MFTDMCMSTLFIIALIFSVIIYLQYRLTVIYDFEIINGPVLLLDKAGFEQHSKQDQRYYHLLAVTTPSGVHHFKAPLFFKELTTNRQQYIIKQAARSNGVRLKQFDVTFINPEQTP